MNRQLQLFLFCCCTLLLSLLLSACAGTPITEPLSKKNDQQWLDNMQSGRDAFDLGQFRLASSLFARALERGRLMDRTEDISDAAFNLAATQMQLDDFTAADRSLQEAKNENRRSGGSLDEILLLEARLAWLQNDITRARSITSQLLQSSTTGQQLRRQIQLLNGLLACEAGDLLLAEQELAKTASLSTSDSQPAIAASRAGLQGCIALLQEQPLEAAAAFDQQSLLQQQAHQYRQMVAALHKAGTAYLAAENQQMAADRLFRAARSAFSQKRLVMGKMLLEKADSAANSANDQLLLESIERLRLSLGDI